MRKHICVVIFFTLISACCLQTARVPAMEVAFLPSFFELGDDYSVPVRFVAFSPDSKKILTTGNKYIAQTWDAEAGKELQKFDADVNTPESVIERRNPSKLVSGAFSPDGKRIAAVSLDNAVRIWNGDTGKVLQSFVGHGKFEESSRGVVSVVFSPDGCKIATAAWDGTARIWNAELGKELHKLEHAGNWVNSATFSPDGKKLLTHTHTDHFVRIWDVNTGELLRELKGHTGHITSAIFSPGGKKVITTAQDDTARIWDADSGKELHKLDNVSESVPISPDGKKIAYTARDKTVRIWNLDSGKEMQTLKEQDGHDYAMLPIAFSPDGKTIVTASRERRGVVRIWDIAFGKELQTLKGFQAPLSQFSTTLSPDGKKIAVTGGDAHHGNIYVTRVWILK